MPNLNSYLHRTMSEGKSASWHSRVCDEGLAKESRRAGAAEYVTKDGAAEYVNDK